MPLQSYQLKIIRLYMEQELALATLYEKFSRAYPEYGDYWLTMAKDEREHAGWVKLLGEQTERGKVIFGEGKARTYTVASFISYVKGILTRLDRENFTMVTAVAIASDIEASLLERNVFTLFRGESAEAARIIGTLQEGQKSHAAKLARLAGSLKSNS